VPDDFQFVDLPSKSIDELSELFRICDECQAYSQASQILDELLSRSHDAPKPVSSVPTWFPRVFWHQKSDR